MIAAKQNDVTKKVADKLWKAFGQEPRGRTIPYTELLAVMGLPATTDRMANEFRAPLLKFRKRLRKERGIVCYVPPTVGLHLYTDDEQVIDEPNRQMRRSLRANRRAVTAATLVDPENLSPQARLMRLHRIESGRLITRRQLSAQRHAAKCQRGSDTVPKRQLVG